MARVLLLDSDESHAHEVAAYLESRRYSVKVCLDIEHAAVALREDHADFDVFILYISGDCPEDWEVLDSLRGLIGPRIPGPGILCVVRQDKGPHAVLMAENKGARCVVEG